MRILLCDDDVTVIDELQRYLQDFFDGHQVSPPAYAAYTDGESLLSQETGGGDIAFLDVKMLGINGIDVGAALKKRNPNVKIFIVTAYMDYLDEAMKFQVFRYLTKPINKERLFRNMQDALDQYFEDEQLVLLETKDGTTVLRENEIVFVETAGRGTTVHTKDHIYSSVKNMDAWRQELRSRSFYVPHRSYMVNMRFVSFFNNTTIVVKDAAGVEHTLCMSRRRFSGFREAYLLYSATRM